MKKATRPAIFKWRQTESELILCAVRWYLRYSLSLRDVEELLSERGLEADHTTIWRWVQRYGPEQEEQLRVQLGGSSLREGRERVSFGVSVVPTRAAGICSLREQRDL